MRIGSVAESAGKPADMGGDKPVVSGFRPVFAVEDNATPALRRYQAAVERMRDALALDARFEPVRAAVAQVIARESEIAHGEILRAAKAARRSIGQHGRRGMEWIRPTWPLSWAR